MSIETRVEGGYLMEQGALSTTEAVKRFVLDVNEYGNEIIVMAIKCGLKGHRRWSEPNSFIA